MIQFVTWLFSACDTIVKLVIGGSRNQQQVQHLQDEMQSFISDKDYGKTALATDVASQLATWQKLYLDEFGLTCDFSSLVIPTQHKGFDRLIVVAQGLTIEQTFQQCKKHFPCWKYTDHDLDEAVPTNDRNPQNSSYVIWVRDRIEADQEHRNRSAHLKRRNVPGITLLERLLFELAYFLEKGKHLDLQNLTLCLGSRFVGGLVPYVVWGGSDLSVYWYNPGHASGSGHLRSREVVSA
jgi:hypothetical protein